MLKKIWIVLAAIVPYYGICQVNISAQLPPAGLVQKNQLWNLVLMNTGQGSEEINLRFDMRDAVTAQPVLSGSSGFFSIGKGIKVINNNDLQPLTYNFTAADFSRDYIPMGSYIVCYQVFSPGKAQMLGEECVRINIDPLSPPMLNTPYDKEEILTPYPQFTWMPPAPFDMFSRLNYDLQVTEVLPGQSPADAVEYNVPVYNRSNITQTAEAYPQSFSQLDTGKLYAWQVVARNGENYAAKTEVWTFKLKTVQTPVNTISQTYVQLNSDATQNEIFTIIGDVLNLKYYSYDPEFSSAIRIFSPDGKLIGEKNAKISYGENYLKIALPASLKTETQYSVEITKASGQKVSAKFQIQKK